VYPEDINYQDEDDTDPDELDGQDLTDTNDCSVCCDDSWADGFVSDLEDELLKGDQYFFDC